MERKSVIIVRQVLLRSGYREIFTAEEPDILTDIMRKIGTMKKRITALLLSMVMVISLAACSSAKSEDSNNSDKTESTKAVEDMTYDELVEAAKGTTADFLLFFHLYSPLYFLSLHFRIDELP